jgi:hypothetical protein
MTPSSCKVFPYAKCQNPNYNINIIPVHQEPKIIRPKAITQLKMNGLCFDGSKVSEVQLERCVNSSPSQKWYHEFGQIRNVENGLCLDARPGYIYLSPCQVFPPKKTTFWIRQPLPHPKKTVYSLVNAESGNCIHSVKPAYFSSRHLQLGTDFCNQNGRDEFGPPQYIDGLEVFDSYESSCIRDSSHKKPRLDIREMSEKERSGFFGALNQMQHLPSLMGR